jgi:5-formyltetrahydrofolate cyclo-ligase
MTKHELRKIYLSKRTSLSDSEYKELNRKLADTFFSSFDFSSIQVIHTFLPIEKTKEPDTWLIIQGLTKKHKGISISIPRINNETAMIDNFFFENEDQLELNMWGIPEPKQGIPTPIEKIDAVLVPLLAADTEGNRVGYGRGFYDKFLDVCNSSVKTIGLSFYPPVEKISDINSIDHRLTHLVTPGKLYEFSR